jgi:hypothetical protein
VVAGVVVLVAGCGKPSEQVAHTGAGGTSGIDASTESDAATERSAVELAHDLYERRRIAVDATSVYRSSGIGGVPVGAVMKVSIDGGEPTTLAVETAGDLSVDSNDVYWAKYMYSHGGLEPPDTQPGSLSKMPLHGGRELRCFP